MATDRNHLPERKQHLFLASASRHNMRRDLLAPMSHNRSATLRACKDLLALGSCLTVVKRNRRGSVLVSLATGLLGLIIIFPWLGHATWHAYRQMRPAP